jgi:hypothetical protein
MPRNENYSASRDREAHTKFDVRYWEESRYSLAKSLFRLFVPETAEGGKDNKAPKDSTGKLDDDSDKGGSGDDKGSGGDKSRWPGNTSSGSDSWDWSSGSLKPESDSWRWNSGSGSGAGAKRWSDGTACRPCSSGAVSRTPSCAKGHVSTLTTLVLPVPAQGMQPVIAIPTPMAGTLGTLSLACSFGWYLIMSTAGLYTLRVVPEIVDVAVEGVEQVVVETVEGSKRVIRVISIGIMIIATIAVSWVGYLLLRVVYERILRLTIFRKAEKCLFDAFALKYGGRLKGGMKSDEEKANGLPMVPYVLPLANLSVNEVLGMPVMEEDPEAIIYRVDPRLLEIGDEFSYVYSRGTRQGQWKTIILNAKVHEAGRKNSLLICDEVDP